MRVLVTGSRDWPDKYVVFDALQKAFELSNGNMVVVHGGCPTGADAYAAEWVRLRMGFLGYMVDDEPHRADWKGPRKKGAGYARNAEMVNLGADLCLAFIYNDSDGATHCSGLAKKAGIKTETFKDGTSMAFKRVEEEIKLEGVRLIWRNFAGEEKPFNAAGKRNFAIPLEEELAKELAAIGWNVKEKEKDGEMLYHLPVTVKFGKKPPRLFMITKSKNKRTPLDEDTAMLLDVAEFENVDVILRPYNWDVQGKQGVSAYLKTLFATIREDELELKYDHIPIDGAPLEIENIIDVEGEWVDDDGEDLLAITAGQKELE